jgi:hypothetical protein
MVAPVNPDKSISTRIDSQSQSVQQRSTTQGRQTTDSTPKRPAETEDSRVDVESARQFYQMENHRATGASRISNPDQASDLLGRILQQFTANPGQSLQAQSSPNPATLSNLLERAPV